MSDIINPTPQVAQHLIKHDDEFPNNPNLPVLHYKAVFLKSNENVGDNMEKCFRDNNWTNAWRNGIHEFQHYHSTAHEVLGVYSGHCKLQVGGPDGIILELMEGDVVVLPAGVAHKNVSSTNDFKCIGAYPDGQDFDMKYGKADEYETAKEEIGRVRLPATDPVFGKGGFLLEHWMLREKAS